MTKQLRVIETDEQVNEVAQEWFDTVARHLIEQNARSLSDGEGLLEARCMYRGTEGRKCAVGVLISDEHYYAHLENMVASTVLVFGVVCASQGIEVPSDAHKDVLKGLLTELQLVHDCALIRVWHRELKWIAVARKLEFKL